MLKKQSYSLSGLGTKTNLTNILLVANAFVWYYTVLAAMQEAVGRLSPAGSLTSIMVWAIHFSGLIFSALIGASLAKKIERTRLLMLWMILGIISSMALFALNSSSVFIISLIGLLLSVSLGLGMPTCVSYYTDNIQVENRGRIGGVTLLASGVGILAFGLASIGDPLILGIVLAAWRSLSLVVFLSFRSKEKFEAKKNFVSYKLIISQHSFILYFVPWVMFSLVNYLTGPLQPNIDADTTVILNLIQTCFLGLFAVIGGFWLDSVGRKRIAIVGFALVGLGAAILGVAPTNPLSWYFNAMVNGTAWGFLLVLFILTIWSDLSYSLSSDKYYALGAMPFFVSKFLELNLGAEIGANVPATALFSFTAFFLFLAILPLIYAPETLPEKHIRDMELKTYLEKARKIKEKHA